MTTPAPAESTKGSSEAVFGLMGGEHQLKHWGVHTWASHHGCELFGLRSVLGGSVALVISNWGSSKKHPGASRQIVA